ncbi:MAG: protoporphyrinogen/coproporphyrinogen oxidase [Chloroflexaceae bacterium]
MTTLGRRVVVIGAGVAGLAAARRLRLAGAEVTVLEQASAPGGRVQTRLVEGCRVELGAEFLADFYTRTFELVRELGLAGELRRIPRSAATLRAGRLYPLWPNLTAALTPLVGSRHKVALSYLVGAVVRHRSRLDTHAFHKAYTLDDVSVAEYARAHLSEEVLEYMLQPPLSGIFYWTPERTSRALLFLALRAGLSRPAGMRLYTLREGLGQLAAALATGHDLRLGAQVETVMPGPGAGYTINGRAGNASFTLAADAVVIATTASAVPQLLPWLDDRRRGFFSAVTYSMTTLLAVVVRGHFPRVAYGTFFPRRETPFLAAATLPAVKDPRFAPPDRDVICLRLSGRAAAALREYADDTLACLMLAELRRLAPEFDPVTRRVFQRLYRCAEALPEFNVGHFHRLQSFTSGAIELPALAFAGDYLGGPFIEGAIVSGERAAERLLDHSQGGLV